MPKRQYHTNIVAAYLVLRQGDQVLLLKRHNTGYEDGNFSLVAGHVEAGETFQAAIVREAKEEANLDIHPDHFSQTYVMHRKSNHDASERVDVFFVTEKWSGEVQNCEPGKCSELSWHPIESLPENTVGYVREALEHILAGKNYAEHGWG